MDLSNEDIEALRIVAESDLRSSRWANKLLESIEGYSSYDSPDREKTHTEPTEITETESEKGILAY